MAADPTVPVSTAADTTWDLVTKDGPLWGALLIAMSLLRAFLDKQHWVQQGRVLSGLTGISMIGAAVLAWHFADAPSSGILTALFAAYTLVTHSTLPAKPTSTPTRTGAALLAVLLLGTGAAVAAQVCAAVKSRGVAGLGAAVDCETSELKPLVAELLPLAT